MPEGDGRTATTVTQSTAQPVRDAATLILWRRRGTRLEVLMGERHGASAFLPNRFVFPGGRLDAADYRMRPARPLAPVSLARLGRSTRTGPRKATALALAAIRETFEESGLRLAAPAHGSAPPPPSPAWAAFCAGGLAPDPAPLLYICRAITPPGRPRRFDARFFAAPAELASGEPRPSAELDKLDWVAPEETGHMLLPGITRYVLGHLAAWLEPDALDDPARQVPFHFMRHGRRQLEWE